MTNSLENINIHREKVESELSIFIPSIAEYIKQQFNLIDIKHGFSHVSTAKDEFVPVVAHTLAHILEFNLEQTESLGNVVYLCWIAVPIDDSDCVIKTSQKYLKFVSVCSAVCAFQRVARCECSGVQRSEFSPFDHLRSDSGKCFSSDFSRPLSMRIHSL